VTTQAPQATEWRDKVTEQEERGTSRNKNKEKKILVPVSIGDHRPICLFAFACHWHQGLQKQRQEHEWAYLHFPPSEITVPVISNVPTPANGTNND
jgi:hypothetical protein